ncbi:tetratricopeptide repeat protein [candidate division KSB1 bacterium]|nr:tetratricopeptide repeat protein [candidate division KSB1 bacterium]
MNALKNKTHAFLPLFAACWITAVLLLLGCSSDRTGKLAALWQRQRALKGTLEITYPRPGTLFPPEIVAPTIVWSDFSTTADTWLIAAGGQDSADVFAVTKQNSWRPDSSLWEFLKQEGSTKDIFVSVIGFQKNTIVSGAQTVFRTSKDSVNAAIFYRAVPLPFSFALENLDKIRWHLGEISSYRTAPALLNNLPLCGNCHSFTSDGGTVAMDVDYANDKGSYVISVISKETVLTPEKIITWSDYRPQDTQKTFGLLSQISPDGRYVASTVKDRSIFVAKDDLAYSQLFFPIKGIIVLYDRQTGQFFALPGADDPDYVQSNPVWSPDGLYIYFAKTKRYYSERAEGSESAVLPTEYASEFIEGKQDFKYDIYRIPFNSGRGGRAVPVPGASNNGRSNYFPRISPDGRWMVFTQADNFMLLQPDSKLLILPAQGGTPRLLTCNNAQMNSWHSWSPNGKWLVFSSKQKGPYTQLWLTHMDDNGRDSPPVLLENMQFDDRAANIPEFVNRKNGDWTRIVDQFSHQSFYYMTIGRHHMGEGNYTQALEAFDQAQKLNPGDPSASVFKGHAYFKLEQFARAVDAYDRAIGLNATERDVYVNKGASLYKMARYKEAIESYNHALELDSEFSYLWFSRGLAKAKLEDVKEAISDYDRAIQLNPNHMAVYYERGICKALLKDFSGAVRDFEKAVLLKPDNQMAAVKLGDGYYNLAAYKKAIEAYGRAIQLAPGNAESYAARGLCYIRLSDYNSALLDFNEAIRLQPDSGLYYCQRGVVRTRTGEKVKACEDFQLALRMGFTDARREIEKHCK